MAAAGYPLNKLNRIGQVLCEMKLLAEEQLQLALAEQSSTHEMLGAILIRRGFATEEGVARAIATQISIPFIGDPLLEIKVAALGLIPESLARRTLSLPLEVRDDGLLVAMADPLNLVHLDDLGYAANRRILPAIATGASILAAIESAYSDIDPIEELIRGIELDQFEIVGQESVDLQKILESDIDAPVVKLSNFILLQAIRLKASDIHIDPTASLTRVRYRVDGLLREIVSPPKKAHAAMCSRIKVLAALNIAEHRIPQDGRTIIRTREGQEVDLRINFVPTIYGEKVNIRLLEQNRRELSAQALGMDAVLSAQFHELIHRPSGMLLVVGPTGSGKTTALYAALSDLNSQTQHLITIEDPVEYRLDGLNQIQVNAKTGMTFAQGLRSILRQDPNVILVGEIRDHETAEIAFEAAMTGHFVLSTAHSTDAAHTIARLVTLGVNPFVAASALTAVVSTRLIRKLCKHCRAPFSPPEAVLRSLGRPSAPQMYQAVGCQKCRQAGYSGRVGIFEIVPITGKLKNLIQSGASIQRLQASLAESDVRSLWMDGVEKVLAGVTTLEEVMRVTRNYLVGDDAEAGGARG